MQGVPPVHEQVGAPLHVTMQLPPVQLVIVQLTALWHVSLQSPPEQAMVHAPPVQSSMQSPEPGHRIAHDAAFVHV